DRNAGCRLTTPEPVENIYWPQGKAPRGDYRVYLNFYQRCSGAPNETEWKINVLYRGERKEFSGTIRKEDTPDGGPRKIIHSFRLDPRVELFAPNAFEVAPGTTLKVPFAIRRDFFFGKVEVKAEGLPAGLTADAVTLQPTQSEGELLL